MSYIEKILNRLLDKVDNKQKRGEVCVQRAISLYTEKEKIFEKYWVEDSYKYRPEIHEAVNFLVKQDLIIAEYDSDTNILKKVTLNNNKISEAFLFLKRTPKYLAVNEEIRSVNELLATLDCSAVSYKYVSKMINLLKNGRAHLSYFKSLDELAISAAIVKEIENNDDEILLRNFSKKRFKDSKLVEQNDGKLVRIFNEFDDQQYSDFTDLCTVHHIVKDKGYAYVKHGFSFKINNQIINLDDLDVDFAFSDEAIDNMEIISLNKKKVITIENLTTFHYYNDSDAIIIFLGGYHNSMKRKLLQKLNSFNEKLSWFHMGDIDWGGFEIFINLRNMTGIDFKPLKMGISELIKYKNECAHITENDRRKLILLLQNPDAEIFYGTINFMLKNGYKLEQESIIF